MSDQQRKGMQTGPATVWGALLMLTMCYADFAMPQVRDQTVFISTMYETAKHPQSLYVHNTQKTAYQADPSVGSFHYPPLYARIFEPLTQLQPSLALFGWQCLSLLGFAYAVFMIGHAASKMDARGTESNDQGWLAFLFIPFLLSIGNGTGQILFGILPAMLGYYLTNSKREFLGGVLFAACFVEPCLLCPVVFTTLALLGRAKPKCAAGLISGLVLFGGINYFYAPSQFMEWLIMSIPQSVVMFDPALKVQSFVANLPQAVMMLVPLAKQTSVIQFVWLGAGALMLIVLTQISQLVRDTKENFNVVPVTFITGLFTIPLAVPGVRYIDLTALVVIGLIVFSLEWRQATDWRMKSLFRVSVVAINSFGLLAFFKPQFAYPIILTGLLLILSRRLIEAIHLGASEHEALLQPLEFID